ncbi:MAG: glycosyltransferase [Candidatus Cloacimonetes bacterium]|nr:glycosyltransferase [Candidatus Cloacimonadota bacterium]
MKNIYVDFTWMGMNRHKMIHGGGNYAKKITLLLQEKTENFSLNILWHEEHKAVGTDEEKIFNHSKSKVIKIKESLIEYYFPDDAVIFIPLLSVGEFKILKTLKDKNPNLKIYLTIHGLRPLDLFVEKYSNADLAIKNFLFLDCFKDKIKKMAYKYYLRKYLGYCDKIFTVSNYSLQQIVKYVSAKNISFYYQDILFDDQDVKIEFNEKFILFVSGDRMEKNYLRTLKAFCQFKQFNPNDFFLYTTGMDEKKEKEIRKYFTKRDLVIIDKWVKHFDYVEKSVLFDMFKQCSFLLFTSKSEGYGLPVLEALYRGKPVLASYITSIPEVAGPALHYVDPYSIESIVSGLCYMSDVANKEKHIDYIKKILPALQLRIKTDMEILINEIIE